MSSFLVSVGDETDNFYVALERAINSAVSNREVHRKVYTFSLMFFSMVLGGCGVTCHSLNYYKI